MAERGRGEREREARETTEDIRRLSEVEITSTAGHYARVDGWGEGERGRQSRKKMEEREFVCARETDRGQKIVRGQLSRHN